MKHSRQRTPLYWFNWPSHIGGADTKFVHLLPLLAEEYAITVVPNGPEYLKSETWCRYLEQHGVGWALMDDLPNRLEGWAVSLCNGQFFSKGQAAEMKRRGARIAWSNEMMWTFEGELPAIHSGLVDRVMYVSAEQRAVLEPLYTASPVSVDEEAVSGTIARAGAPPMPWVTTGNWIDPGQFPFRQRGMSEAGTFTIGRLSRPDPDKFPDDFPASYERLQLPAPVRFRVMGWSEKLAERWCEHQFDARWELLPQASEPVTAFLNSLDLLVYDLSPRFKESWGRAVVEAMLCGVVPIVPNGGGHHLSQLVRHGVSGFLCDTPDDFGKYSRLLQDHPAMLRELSSGARQDACMRHCNPEVHRDLWRQVFG